MKKYRGKKRRILAITTLVIVSAIMVNSAIYAENSETGTTWSVAEEFLDEARAGAIPGELNIKVFNNENKDVTDEWKDTITTYYNEDEITKIQEIMADKGLFLAHTVIGGEESNSTNAFVTETYSDTFLHTEWDTTGEYAKEWVTSLTGQIRYNYNTLQISYVSSPVLRLEHTSFGFAFSPWMGGVQTGNNTYGSTVYFWGKYRMYASGSFAGSLGTYDFGYHTDQFSVAF